MQVRKALLGASVMSLLLTMGGTALGRDDPALVQRVEKMERLMNSRSMMEMLTRLDQLQREVQQLRGELEVQANTLNTLKGQQRELYQDTDRRLHRLEAGAMPAMSGSVLDSSTTETGGDTLTPETSSPNPPPVVSADPAQERSVYEGALNLLKEGRYPQAADAFRQFRSQYPQSRYSANAQYWLGEAYYVSRDFVTALQQFSQVVEQFPDSSKVADAMLKRGFIYYEQQNWQAARQELESLVARYPQATAARLAKDRLERMSGEGR